MRKNGNVKSVYNSDKTGYQNVWLHHRHFKLISEIIIFLHVISDILSHNKKYHLGHLHDDVPRYQISNIALRAC